MILATSMGLRLVAGLGGIGVGLIAVWLAREIPPRMNLDVDLKQRPTVWWGVSILVGVVYGVAAADAGWWLLPAYLAFGATTLAVTLTDLDYQLIPNRILFPGMGVAAGLLVVGAIIDGVPERLARAAVGGVVYFILLLIVALVARGGFGMGDVKLALLLGLFLGFAGWDALGVGFTLAILLGGVASILLLVFTRRGRRSKFAYGPFLVAGAWIGLFWGSQIADWYLRN